jgi:predicted membrane protein
MKIVEKNNSAKMGTLGVVLLAAGCGLLAGALWMLPSSPVSGFPWEFSLAVVSFLPIMAGGWCLGSLVQHRQNSSSIEGYHNHGGSIPFALLVIVAGAMLLGFNSGVLPMEWRRVFFSWQMLLLVFSMTEYAKGHFTPASVMLAVGGFFIIRRLAPLYPDIEASGAGSSFWPVLLILAGVLILGNIIFKPRCHTSRHQNFEYDRRAFAGEQWGGKGSRASGVIDITTVFGGSEQVYLDPVFRGGKISSVFGGVKLDLRRTGLPEGVTYLEVNSVFGGVEIDAPEEWIIEIRNESVFGGFHDKRLPAVTPGYTDGRKLIIKASNVFGGGEIK